MSHVESSRLPDGASPEGPSGIEHDSRLGAALLGAAAVATLATLVAHRRHGPGTTEVPRIRGRRARATLPVMSLADTLAFTADVPLPNVAKGVIKRRKPVVGLAESLDLDQRGVRRLQRLHEKYGAGPVLLGLPFVNQAVLLDPAHVHEVLRDSPEPFATATDAKRAALRHFEPFGALISHGYDRAERRRLNERVLESDCPMHSLARHFERAAREEARELLAAARRRGGFGWDEFARAWFRVVRRVVLGDSAREDREFHRLLSQLRFDGNWAFVKPRRHGARRAFLARLQAYVARAERGSLASLVAAAPKNGRTRPEHQIPQWLFAFDPAGMTTCRTLALLATHPEQQRRAYAEIESAATGGDRRLPFLRACLLESLRLWPTTPLLLRQSTRPTEWRSGTMPANTGVMIYAPYFHRDDRRLPYANRFAPDVWLRDPPADGWPLVPFSGGPGVCPGRHVVMLVAGAFLAELLDGAGIAVTEPERLDVERLPGSFDHYSMRFRVHARPERRHEAPPARGEDAIRGVSGDPAGRLPPGQHSVQANYEAARRGATRTARA